MNKIAIIGNSAAGITMAETIRAKDKDSQLTIISDEPFLTYRRPGILDLLANKIKEKELFVKSADFYESNSIELLLEREVVDLNLERKRLFFKIKGFLDFDSLIIATGSSVKIPAIKGAHKEGVVALNGLDDVKYVLENLAIAHTVIVVGEDELARQVARVIAEKKIEVKLLGKFSESLEGVDIITDSVITEILGDSEVKAVRLCSNKVIGASLVIWTGPRTANIDFLKETEVKVNKGILVDSAMRTSIPFIFAVGDVAEFSDKDKLYGWDQAVQEARLAAQILGRP